MKKLLILLIALLLVVGTIFVSTAADNSPAPTAQAESAKFGGASLLAQNTTAIRYYTVLTEVADPYDASLLVWNSAQTSYVKGTEKYTVPFEGVIKTVSGVSYHCFDFDDFPVTMLADDFFAVVCINTDSGYVYSEVAKYSVLEYAYTAFGKIGNNPSTDQKLLELLTDMLDYGTSAQKYFNYNTERPANGEYYAVKLTGATLPDGFSKGMYLKGDTLTLTAPESSSEGSFSYWADENGEVVSDSRTLSLTVTKNLTLTAVYGATLKTETPALTIPSFDLNSIPKYSQKDQIGYVAINNNIPFFTQNQIVNESYEYYSPLDSLGRCGIAVASLGVDLLPTESRGDISSVKPTGWHSTTSDTTIASIVPGGSLYNRSHLIAHSLAGEDANKQNLITGTQSFNQIYMQIFENMVLDVMKEYRSAGQDYHVMYRVTPVFEGNNLVATGVIMEGWSVEDNGADVCFCVFVYNEQPGITIDHATGDYSIYNGSEDDGNEGGSTTPDTPTDPETPTETAYYMTFTSNRTTYYFDGTASSGRGGATTNKSQAVKLYIEAVSGGYNIYFIQDGTKKYLSIGEKSQSFSISSSPVTFTKNSDGAYLVGTRTFSFCSTNNDFRTYAYSSNKSMTASFIPVT